MVEHDFERRAALTEKQFHVPHPLKGMSAPSMLTNYAITTGDVPRAYRTCRCGHCGVEDVCTPRTDFMPRASAPDGLLYCRRCL